MAFILKARDGDFRPLSEMKDLLFQKCGESITVISVNCVCVVW